MALTKLRVEDWGLLDYRQALERQAERVRNLLAGDKVDTLVLVEHPATVTLGRRATTADLLCSEHFYAENGIALVNINRGGLATAHEPGQLVIYPVINLKKHDLRWFAECFLNVVVEVLADYGITGRLKAGEPGVWVDGRKICSFGIALKRWVSSHGIALNVNNNLETFAMIVPCGQPRELVTSLAKEQGCLIDMALLKKRFVQHFCEAFEYYPEEELS